jgi:hypothetical protein
MGFKESIKIEESLVIKIKDRKTDEITEIWIKKPWSKLSLWEKLLIRLGLKKYPGSILAEGLDQMAKCYGDITGKLPVNQIGANGSVSGWIWKASTNTFEATGKLKIDNENSPWSGGENFTQLSCKNSASASQHNSISININLSNASDVDWWAEITFTFS